MLINLNIHSSGQISPLWKSTINMWKYSAGQGKLHNWIFYPHVSGLLSFCMSVFSSFCLFVFLSFCFSVFCFAAFFVFSPLFFCSSQSSKLISIQFVCLCVFLFFCFFCLFCFSSSVFLFILVQLASELIQFYGLDGHHKSSQVIGLLKAPMVLIIFKGQI